MVCGLGAVNCPFVDMEVGGFNPFGLAVEPFSMHTIVFPPCWLNDSVSLVAGESLSCPLLLPLKVEKVLSGGAIVETWVVAIFEKRFCGRLVDLDKSDELMSLWIAVSSSEECGVVQLSANFFRVKCLSLEVGRCGFAKSGGLLADED